MNTSPIAVRDLVAESPDGTRFNVTLRIGAPRPGNHNDWVCSIETEGMSPRLSDSHGTDSMQALLLAISSARSRLNRFAKDGGKFYWPGDEASGSMSVAELFSDVV
ncbi:MAG: hypothetical protein ISP90_13815 [Nevskia sp.]|nr:hypothetical protein [Nevskia sp.]